MGATIRPTSAGDRLGWEGLWAGYLAFYEEELPPTVTERTWERLLAPDGALHGHVAVDDASGEVVGFSHHLFHPSTWSMAPYCYLEDLFVEPAARGLGAGRALLEAVRAAAVAEGAEKLYWQTHASNAVARRLYDDVADHAGFLVYEASLPRPADE